MDYCGELEHRFYNDDEIEECCESFVSESTVYFNFIGASFCSLITYEGWKFNSGNYLFTTDTK